MWNSYKAALATITFSCISLLNGIMELIPHSFSTPFSLKLLESAFEDNDCEIQHVFQSNVVCKKMKNKFRNEKWPTKQHLIRIKFAVYYYDILRVICFNNKNLFDAFIYMNMRLCRNHLTANEEKERNSNCQSGLNHIRRWPDNLPIELDSTLNALLDCS